MKTTTLLGRLAMASLVLLAACDAGEAGDEARVKKKETGAAATADDEGDGSGAETSAGSGRGGGSDAGTGGVTTSGDAIFVPTPPPPQEPAPPAEPAACSIPEATGVATVQPTFIVVDKNVAAPVATGGTLTGSFKVDKATVYLPNSLKGLVKPESSSGAVTAWAVFDGKRHRFSMKVDVSVDSKRGPQKQTTDVLSHGTYVVAGNKVDVETTCDGQAVPATEVTFSDQGARVMFILKVPTNRGDVIMALEAPRER